MARAWQPLADAESRDAGPYETGARWVTADGLHAHADARMCTARTCTATCDLVQAQRA